jgi:hypothetical protein
MCSLTVYVSSGKQALSRTLDKLFWRFDVSTLLILLAHCSTRRPWPPHPCTSRDARLGTRFFQAPVPMRTNVQPLLPPTGSGMRCALGYRIPRADAPSAGRMSSPYDGARRGPRSAPGGRHGSGGPEATARCTARAFKAAGDAFSAGLLIGHPSQEARVPVPPCVRKSIAASVLCRGGL